MEFKLQRGTSKVNFELEQKMLEVEQQKAKLNTENDLHWRKRN